MKRHTYQWKSKGIFKCWKWKLPSIQKSGQMEAGDSRGRVPGVRATRKSIAKEKEKKDQRESKESEMRMKRNLKFRKEQKCQTRKSQKEEQQLKDTRLIGTHTHRTHTNTRTQQLRHTHSHTHTFCRTTQSQIFDVGDFFFNFFSVFNTL